jgi:hypothetical protein
LDGPSSADTLKFVFLQNTQQSNLGLGKKLSDFIEEDRTSFCKFEPPQAPLQRSSERALLVAKQFRGNQVARDGSTVGTDKSSWASVRPPVNGARNKFLACPGFAHDQNGGVCGSNLTCTVIIRQKESKRLAWTHRVIHGGDLVWKGINKCGVDGEDRVKQMG